MSPLVQALKRFNRKERFWLLSDALGETFLSLDSLFIEKVSKTLGIDVPSNAWWAFDYHLDWLAAVLWTAPNFDVSASMDAAVNEPCYIKGNQQDVDLIIAFDATLIIIEAKLSTPWSNKQLRQKLERLHRLPIEHLRAYFILTSPSEPLRLARTHPWPPWALQGPEGAKRPYFMKLHGDESGLRPLMVSRCHPEGTKPAKGRHWKIFDA